MRTKTICCMSSSNSNNNNRVVVSYRILVVIVVLPSSIAVLDPRVDHTMYILSPFTSVLCHSD